MSLSPYQILYEDDRIIVVFKNRDVFTIKTDDKKTFSYNLYHYLYLYLRKKGEKPYLVHRLDYETSGILIFAKDDITQMKLRKCFEERRVIRLYEAVVKEDLPFGFQKEVRMYLSKNETGKKIVPTSALEGKEAITIYQVRNKIQIGTALKIQILTGRRNQIRIALKEEGLTLIGDRRYSQDEAKRMYLNSYYLKFPLDCGLKKSEFLLSPLWLKGEDYEPLSK